MRLRATVVVEYNANPAHYETYDEIEAAEIDQRNWRDNPLTFWMSFDDPEFSVTVEPARSEDTSKEAGR